MLGADLSLNALRAGHLYIGAARTQATNAGSVSGAIEILNARGGPGIVLASVAFDAGIISPSFYTTLVLVAVLTSQAAGAWLGFIVRRGWPLLVNEPDNRVTQIPAAETKAA